MRLLNVHTLEVELFSSDSVPHYAAASHRWLNDAECSFQGVQAKRNLASPGFRKIERFATFVCNHVQHVNYLWIDTCCIDKTSSQELQEAITAMYRWYEGATVCLALLNDIDDDVAPLSQSVWFTRGWTLQELLAPRLVVFLSSRWEVLGHKAQDSLGDLAPLLAWSGPRLNHTISEITGIPESVLSQPERRRQLSADERIGWMSKRKTTRPEDMAYSLLGILEVSMPLIYEEGQAAAERRLRRAVIEVHGHHHSPTQASSNVPFMRDPGFIDREELHRLEHMLASGAARVALLGLGGVGKSQLAIEYCYRLRERQPNTWTLWIHAGSEARYEESLRNLANDAHIPDNNDAKVRIFDLVYDWLRDSRNGNWMLVLDNADDAGFLFEPPPLDVGADGSHVSGTMRTRLELLPICAHGSIIVTSRYRDTATRIVDHDHHITVPPMEQSNAAALLRGRLGRESDEVASKQLVSALDCMPLAISQAAAYIKRREPRCSIEQYLESLTKSSKSRTRILSTDSIELRRDPEAVNSITLTWQISFEHIQSVRPSATDVLSFMSFFDHQSIPESLLRVDAHENLTSARTSGGSLSEADDDDGTFEDDITTLRDYDFISLAPGGREFKMHRLVQLATRSWVESKGCHEHYAAKCISSLNVLLPHCDYSNWRLWEVLYPHTKKMLDLHPTTRDARIQRSSLLCKTSNFALDKQALGEAEIFARHSMLERQELLGEGHPETMVCVGVLALVYWGQRRYVEAEKLQRQALDLLDKALGREDQETLTALVNLSMTCKDLEKYEEAESLCEQALELEKKLLGEEHANTILSMGNLAVIYNCQGRYAEAEKMAVQVFELRRKTLGREHPDTLLSMSNLAKTLLNQERFAESEELNLQTLALRRKVLGEEHPTTVESMVNLAYMYYDQKRYVEAERFLVLLYELAPKVLGMTHPDTEECLDLLIDTYRELGKEAEADRLEASKNS